MLHSLSLPPAATADPDSRAQSVLIYFIPGNPGFIEFYRPHLTTLRGLLDEWSSSSSSNNNAAGGVSFHIYGQDLAGFSDGDGHAPFSWPHNPPFGVDHQIRTTAAGLAALQARHAFDAVILVGHSVGSFIALQTMHRYYLSPASSSSSSSSSSSDDLPLPSVKFQAGVLLFPTITHIAASPSGRKLSLVRRLLYPGYPPLSSSSSSSSSSTPRRDPPPFIQRYLVPFVLTVALRGVLGALLGAAALSRVVRAVLGFPPHAADVVAAWLGQRDGVWQALHMGFDELEVIAGDEEDSRLWGERAVVGAADAVGGDGGDGNGERAESLEMPSFYFLFGRDDHWVADHHRDVFIEKRRRANEANKKTMRDDTPAIGARRNTVVVDEGDLPHAFCIPK